MGNWISRTPNWSDSPKMYPDVSAIAPRGCGVGPSKERFAALGLCFQRRRAAGHWLRLSAQVAAIISIGRSYPLNRLVVVTA
jgi:hypothetical protein